jgi:hypothetical protein
VDLELPIALEKSGCITPTVVKKKVVSTPVANTNEIVTPDPSKVEIPLTQAEIAEANCLLETGKPCPTIKPLPVQEQPLEVLPSTDQSIDDLTLEPLL